MSRIGMAWITSGLPSIVLMTTTSRRLPAASGPMSSQRSGSLAGVFDCERYRRCSSIQRLPHPLWVYARGMAKTIQVRDVPDDVHRRLTVRAAEERRSLSELVRAEIVEIARRPTMAEMLVRLANRPGLELPESSADALAAERRGN